MLELLKTAPRVVGIKQSTRAVRDGKAQLVFIARDADPHVTQQLENLCKEKCIEIVQVETMRELGNACGIDVGAASAVILKSE